MVRIYETEIQCQSYHNLNKKHLDKFSSFERRHYFCRHSRAKTYNKQHEQKHTDIDAHFLFNYVANTIDASGKYVTLAIEPRFHD
jgi:hypothetical protein